jgi:ACR3 family arsenite transporter
VWSYLSDGDPNYTLVQVSVNDLLMLLLFVPIVTLLMGVTGIPIPYGTLLTSLGLFVGLPLLAGFAANRLLIARKGHRWYQQRFLPALKPLSITALLLTLVLLFALQGEALLRQPLIILLIAVPLTLQTYAIFFLTWGLGRLARLPYGQCAPGAMIGASNFFELAVAVAIALFGLDSGAALATVTGVLIEVPVMLSLVRIARAWRYAASPTGAPAAPAQQPSSAQQDRAE